MDYTSTLETLEGFSNELDIALTKFELGRSSTPWLRLESPKNCSW